MSRECVGTLAQNARMYLVALATCGATIIDPTPVDPLAAEGADLDRLLAATASTITDHLLAGCPGCRVRLTVWSRCRVIAETEFTDEWLHLTV